MDDQDVQLSFFPSTLAPGDRDDWAKIVVDALQDDPGALTVVFTALEGGVWHLNRVLWIRRQPGSAGGMAPQEGTAQIRARILRALVGAGRHVV